MRFIATNFRSQMRKLSISNPFNLFHLRLLFRPRWLLKTTLIKKFSIVWRIICIFIKQRAEALRAKVFKYRSFLRRRRDFMNEVAWVNFANESDGWHSTRSQKGKKARNQRKRERTWFFYKLTNCEMFLGWLENVRTASNILRRNDAINGSIWTSQDLPIHVLSSEQKQ